MKITIVKYLANNYFHVSGNSCNIIALMASDVIDTAGKKSWLGGMVFKGMRLKRIGINNVPGMNLNSFILRAELKRTLEHMHGFLIRMLVHGNLTPRFQNKISERKIMIIFIPTRFGIHDPANSTSLNRHFFTVAHSLCDFNLFNIPYISYDHTSLL